MERAIGEIFDFGGVKLRVERTNNPVCDGCHFEQFNHGCWQINGIEETGLCYGGFRSDKNDVIFIEVKDDQGKEEES